MAYTLPISPTKQSAKTHKYTLPPAFSTSFNVSSTLATDTVTRNAKRALASLSGWIAGDRKLSFSTCRTLSASVLGDLHDGNERNRGSTHMHKRASHRPIREQHHRRRNPSRCHSLRSRRACPAEDGAVEALRAREVGAGDFSP